MKTLKQFYREMQAWIDAGCPEHEAFHTDYGLCFNLELWSHFDHDLNAELRDSIGTEYPFNNDSGEDYFSEIHHYKNPARLAWVKDEI